MMSTYLITGATSDLGCALIEGLANKDDRYILQGYHDGSKLQQKCQELGLDYTYYDVNLTSRDEIEAFADEVAKEPVSHFIHLPALSLVYTRFSKMDLERYLADINVQVVSAASICKRILPGMQKSKYGRILFVITSCVLPGPPKNAAGYTMSKSSVLGLMRSLAVDYASKGITVNGVSPSMIETKFLADTSHLIVEASAKSNPMGRNATVDDVVPAMRFLLSDEASYITGVNLPITGGSVIL